MTDFLERFEAFARSKPAGERYDPCDSHHCALGQFGYTDAAGPHSAVAAGVPEAAFWAAITSDNGGSSFGALAERLAALREQQS